jgi:hypothetical protein
MSLFMIVLSGSASFAAASSSMSDIFSVSPALIALTSSFIVTVAGLADLVFDFSGMASRHGVLRRASYSLLAQSGDESRTLSRLQEEMDRVYAEEPPTMHGVNSVAFNNTVASLGHEEKKQLRIWPWQKAFRNYVSFASTRFQTYEELGIDPSAPGWLSRLVGARSVRPQPKKLARRA